MHKRLIATIMLITVLLLSSLVGCSSSSKDNPLSKNKKRENDGRFSVHYLDVGQGDAIFLHFPDGKTMLIDSGNAQRENSEYVVNFLKNFNISTIDYFVLTHPDSDHIGGAYSVIENFKIGKAYIPHILQPQNFGEFNNVFSLLNQKQIKTEISTIYKHVKGQDYTVAFLTPYPIDFPFGESSYSKINSEYPTDTDINNVSPIIYVQYKGVRFLFTGDAGGSQERILIDDKRVLATTFNSLGIDINLEYIDFLKVAHHGANDCSSVEFLNLIKPKNAIVSVGGGNPYGHPSTSVLERLATANPAHTLYRTDVYGTISVYVSINGQMEIITDAD